MHNEHIKLVGILQICVIEHHSISRSLMQHQHNLAHVNMTNQCHKLLKLSSILSDKFLPIVLVTGTNCKNCSQILLSFCSSIYRTHKENCSMVEMSQVSSARMEKHFTELIFFDQSVQNCFVTCIYNFILYISANVRSIFGRMFKMFSEVFITCIDSLS